MSTLETGVVLGVVAIGAYLIYTRMNAPAPAPATSSSLGGWLTQLFGGPGATTTPMSPNDPFYLATPSDQSSGALGEVLSQL